MYQIYQVNNETLEDISNKLGININELKRLNGLNNNATLMNGSYIIIPGNTMNKYSTYVVKNGDNMYEIAKKNNIDLDTLISINGLNKNDYIYPNQEIIIPNKNMYVTKENETINDIFTKLNVSVDKIGDLYLVKDQVITY